MPTGYTAGVQDGTVTDFATFAMQCARNFGALVMMRDERWDAEIPTAFEPHTDYYDTSERNARETLVMLATLTPEQADERAKADYDTEVAAWHERRAERAKHRQRYEAMLAHVRAWTPPTSEHVEMRNFMETQLIESIKFDCSGAYDTPPERLDGTAWLAAERLGAEDSIAYAIKHRAEEIERTDRRNAWLAALRRSLTGSARKEERNDG